MNRMQKGFFAGVFLLAGISIATAQSSSEDQQELKLPDDLEITTPDDLTLDSGEDTQEDITITTTDRYQMQEHRVGNRLDRVTVKWNNGITEVYQNERDDTIWFAEEESLGDRPNVRKWRIGSW